ncbi:LANO_0E14554g1_1 [Lachancea nothofagi CBS 11611]|uniref:LANO_0E14554g1_1 n=1 Tax=Lachancea nothofagi CBS 11611 TaxID=1266666 RepID=A0A1G4K037_9SACH|nr:LANO_0E14554g1_1 [Lachancea nothofagi CBS 11611]
MNLNEFAEAQKPHYTVYPKVKRRKVSCLKGVDPFVKLLSGKESLEMVHKRWTLYHQLHSQFYAQVDDIVERIELDMRREISSVLAKETNLLSPCFNCLFLLGSDSTTSIELPNDDANKMNVIIDLTPKESPNVRMMLRRSMFRLLSAAESPNQTTKNVLKTEHSEDLVEVGDGLDLASSPDLGVSYDLSLVQNFRKIFRKGLKLVFNFKEVDSFNSQVLDDFINLLKSSLNYEDIEICLVLNINTNLSNIQKNLRQSTIRLLKKNFSVIDLSHNKGFKYANQTFQSFLNTVDGKLNLSSEFVEFILDKMSNNSTHNLQLLTKILDYSLMSYFFQNPFSVFIDQTNVRHFDENYLPPLVKCPTFMTFIEGMVRNHAPSEEIMCLLENEDSNLEEFFAEFLVRENPINGHLKLVVEVLENQLGVFNYNLIDLYFHMLTGKLSTFLSRWPECQEFDDILKFEPVDIVFQELFTLDNSKELFSQSLFPYLRTNLEDNLINSDRIMPPPSKRTHKPKTPQEDFGTLIDLPLCQLFGLYREASSLINLFDFYCAFKETLPKDQLLNYVKSILDLKMFELTEEQRTRLLAMAKDDDLSNLVDKMILVWFIQSVSEFQQIGLLKTNNNSSYEVVEKCIWRGL